MYRQNKHLCLLLFMFLLSAVPLYAAAPSSSDEKLDSYLQDRGFRELLALHWEEELTSLNGKKRSEMVSRLAGLYGELISDSQNKVTRSRWESKSRRLLPEMSETDAVALQLELIRSHYLPAEATAEKYRLRLIDSGDVTSAITELKSSADELASLNTLLDKRITQLAALAGREGKRAEQAARTLSSLSQLQTWVSYYLGWSRYYKAFLNGDDQTAYDAIVAFGSLLGASEGRSPSLVDFPRDQMRFEVKARAVIGVALCLSLRDEPNEAVRWLDFLESAEDLPESIKEQIPTRRLIILAHDGQWLAFANIRETLQNDNKLSPMLNRLIAVLALQWHVVHGDDQSLKEAGLALSRLGDAGELAHIIDISRIFGTDALGSRGFIANYVKGMDAFQRARGIHQRAGDDTRPSADPAVVRSYRPAVQYFRDALASEDADAFPDALRSARRQCGLALYYSSRFSEAADLFLADTGSRDEDSASSLYFAIISFEAEMKQTDSDTEKEKLRIALGKYIDQYKKLYPEGDHIADIRIKEATLLNLSSERSLALLLSVPRDADSYETARRQAARVLWQIYRRAEPFDKPGIARRYINIAYPLANADYEKAEAGDAQAASLFIGRARRILEASLTFGLEDTDTARSILALLHSAVENDWPSVPNLDTELIYRDVQVLTAENNLPAAVNVIIDNRPSVNTDKYVIAATRIVLKSLIITHPEEEQNQTETADLVVRLGEMLIDDMGGDAEAVIKLGPGLIKPLAEAHLYLYRNRGSAQDRTRTMQLLDRLISADQADAGSCVTAARLHEETGNQEQALELWTRAADLLTENSNRWLEAKYNLLRLLLAVHPQVARQVLAQYQVLYPELGPPPWGNKIRELINKLNNTSNTEASP